MTTFESDIKTVAHSQENVYRILSNLSNLERLKDRIPQDKISDFSFDNDSCSFTFDRIGKLKLSVVERDPIQSIRLAVDQLPIEVSLCIQLTASGVTETQLKLTIRAALNPFLKPIFSKPLQEGINQIATILAALPYESI
jgi:hypothetical protein